MTLVAEVAAPAAVVAPISLMAAASEEQANTITVAAAEIPVMCRVLDNLRRTGLDAGGQITRSCGIGVCWRGHETGCERCEGRRDDCFA